jgi:hypothetical protein
MILSSLAVGRKPMLSRSGQACATYGTDGLAATAVLVVACHAARFACRPAPCRACAQVNVLAFYDDAGQPACATCTGNPAVCACVQRGGEDSPYGVVCGRCALTRRVTELLTAPPPGSSAPSCNRCSTPWSTRARAPRSTGSPTRTDRRSFERWPSTRPSARPRLTGSPRPGGPDPPLQQGRPRRSPRTPEQNRREGQHFPGELAVLIDVADQLEVVVDGARGEPNRSG